MTIKKQLLVIGAGASGLPSIRHALFYENLEVTCFEKSDNIGGLWNYKPHDTDLSSVMKSTVINTSKEMTSYSDFPPEDTMANFMHNREMHRYLCNYAKHFGLTKYIKLNHTVLSIGRNDSYEKDGKWKVKYEDNNGAKCEKIFDGIMMCSGHHAIPYFPPKWPGQEMFKGRIVHSHSYKDHKGYEGKTAIVVGIGNSGADCAVELSRHSEQVYLVTRRGSWVYHRLFLKGEPLDMAFNTKFTMDLQKVLPFRLINFNFETLCNLKFDHVNYGLKPNHRVLEAHPTMNDDLPNRIACGTVAVKPGIREFTETTVIFEDGTEVENVDEIILATGYSFNFNLVENGQLIKVDENRMDAYKYVFPIATSDHNSFGIIGLVQPVGSVIPISEMQARVFLESFAGSYELPSTEEMEADITKKRIEMAHRYIPSRRHTIQVDFLQYMHELADLIGCSPKMSALWCNNPLLAWKVYFGPCVSYMFRLNGPNTWEDAEDAIRDVNYRMICATNPKLKRNTESKKNV